MQLFRFLVNLFLGWVLFFWSSFCALWIPMIAEKVWFCSRMPIVLGRGWRRYSDYKIKMTNWELWVCWAELIFLCSVFRWKLSQKWSDTIWVNSRFHTSLSSTVVQVSVPHTLPDLSHSSKLYRWGKFVVGWRFDLYCCLTPNVSNIKIKIVLFLLYSY